MGLGQSADNNYKKIYVEKNQKYMSKPKDGILVNRIKEADEYYSKGWYQKSLKLYEEIANSVECVPYVFNQLGIQYWYGMGVKEDNAKAKYYFSKMAESKSLDAGIGYKNLAVLADQEGNNEQMVYYLMLSNRQYIDIVKQKNNENITTLQHLLST